ncbi:hypothetical protein QZH41_014754 [Actinostola sp. cb2023]|nr:hypothetical protein QZH41_014754 [Actinostola sp. cb2023]
MSANSTSAPTLNLFHCSNRGKYAILPCIIIVMLGIFPNGSIIIVLARKLRRLTVGNLMILHLAVGDFLLLATSVPHVFLSMLRSPLIFEPFLCQWTAFFNRFFFALSMYLITVMAITRCYSVLKPFDYRANVFPSIVNRICLGAWLVCLILSMTPFFGWGEYEVIDGQCWCTVDSSKYPYNWFTFFSLVFALPMLVNILVFTSTVKVLISRKKIGHREKKRKQTVEAKPASPGKLTFSKGEFKTDSEVPEVGVQGTYTKKTDVEDSQESGKVIKAEQNNMGNKAGRVSTSILSLNDHCLIEIMSYLDDFSSFYDFALTCKRFHQATLSTRDWQVNVKIRKMKFYTLKFIMEEDLIQQMPSSLRWTSISGLVRLAAMYRATKPTYTNVLSVWKSRGPVAAELFAWINNLRNVDYDEDFSKLLLTFQLPRRDEEMIIEFEHLDLIFTPGNLTIIEIIVNRRKSMHTLETLSTTNFFLDRILPGSCYLDWSEEEMRRVIELLRPAIDILQEELGETNPPITARFFLWFCFYPASLEFKSNDEDKLYFKDPVKNEEPTPESVQPALDRLEKIQSLMKTIGESNNVKIVEEVMKNLKEHSKSKIFKLLDEEILNVIRKYDILLPAYK